MHEVTLWSQFSMEKYLTQPRQQGGGGGGAWSCLNEWIG